VRSRKTCRLVISPSVIHTTPQKSEAGPASACRPREEPDHVADEPGPDPEDDGIDASELLIVVHNTQPTGDAHHRQSVPEMMEVDSLGDDHEAWEREVKEPGTEEAAQESERRQEGQSVLESASLRLGRHGPGDVRAPNKLRSWAKEAAHVHRNEM